MKLTAAQIQRIRSLESKSGVVSARRVVEDARNPKSPLHGLFDWDTARAAERYWLHRAREIIGAVTVEVTQHKMTIKAPCYVHQPGESSYQRVDAMKRDPEQSRESLVYTLEVASGHLRRALELAGPLGLAPEIDKLIAEVVGVQMLAKRKAAA